MAPSELTWIGGSSYYNRYNAETGLTWAQPVPQPL